MGLYTKNEIRTFMGKMIDPLAPDPELITLVDIAHALSNICRWNGHTMKFYSVAEHCIFVQNLVESREDKIAAMLHDASEAYIADVSRPVKHRLKNYFEIEDDLMMVIAKKFGFQYPLSAEVKKADEYSLNWEWNNIVIADRVPTMQPMQAKRAFMDLMDTLTGNSTYDMYCWSCHRIIPSSEITADKRHDEDKGGCGCYLK
jgi:5'-deoxynucleotidase YfbR-like HD superfamily hydrolase